jgi:hypothetical protein
MGILCVVCVMIGVMAVWGLRETSVSKEPHREEDGIAIAYPFMLTIIPEKNVYEPGETVKMTITLKNVGEENARITFQCSNPNPYWFWRVYDENDQLVFYHKAVSVVEKIYDVTFQPGKSMQRNCTWNQKNADTEQQVPPGTYYLTAAVFFIYNGTEIPLKPQKDISITLP